MQYVQRCYFITLCVFLGIALSWFQLKRLNRCLNCTSFCRCIVNEGKAIIIILIIIMQNCWSEAKLNWFFTINRACQFYSLHCSACICNRWSKPCTLMASILCLQNLSCNLLHGVYAIFVIGMSLPSNVVQHAVCFSGFIRTVILLSQALIIPSS